MASRLRLTDGHGPWLYAPHLALLSTALVDVAAGRIKRLAVQLPPRHGKSVLTSWAFALWYLATWPDRKVILASYGADYAATWGRRVRNSIVEHGRTLGVSLADDSQSAGEWNTGAGGGMISTGVGGGITGRGANILIGDDTIKDFEQASSFTYREYLWDWWQAVALTRLEPDASVVLVQTRWHEDDLIGRILDDPKTADKWKFLRLPAIAEHDDPLGRKPGEALWRARFDEAELASKRQEYGDYVWDALYQQKPPPLKGSNLYGSFDAGRNVDAGVRLVDDLPLQLAVDFNRNPGMHGVLGQHFPHDDLITARHVIHAPRMHIKGMCAELNRMLTNELKDLKYPYIEVFGDATGRIESMADGRSSWDSVQAELQHYEIPYRLNVPRHNPGVFDRVNTVNQTFVAPDGRVRYKIHPDCVPLIRDYKQMKADEQGEENKRDKLLSHASSAEGYRIVILMPILKTEMSGGRVLFST